MAAMAQIAPMVATRIAADVLVKLLDVLFSHCPVRVLNTPPFSHLQSGIGQSVHMLLSNGLYCPVGQTSHLPEVSLNPTVPAQTQESLEVAPVAVVVVSPGHRMHATWPCASWYCP